MASRTVSNVLLITTDMEVVTGAFSTKFVSTGRSDGLLGRLVTNAADQDILTTFRTLLQDQVRMICDLTHLHDQTEDVGVIIEYDSLSHVCIELAIGICHDARRKVAFDLPEEFVMDDYMFGRQFHRSRVVSFESTKHYSIREQAQFVHAFLTNIRIILGDRVENFLDENGDMVETTVMAYVAALRCVLRPMQFLTRTHLAKIASHRLNLQESEKREEFADTVLNGCARQAPLEIAF